MAHFCTKSKGSVILVAFATVGMFFTPYLRRSELDARIGVTTRGSAFPPVSIISTSDIDASSLYTALGLLGYEFRGAEVNGTCPPPRTFTQGGNERCVEVKAVVVGGERTVGGGKMVGGEGRVLRMDLGDGGEGKWEELVGFLGLGYSVLERLNLREWPRDVGDSVMGRFWG